MLAIDAPAKVNLTLEVLLRRPDGYHEVRSLMQAISLCDTLRFEVNTDTRIASDRTDWKPELSLVSRAVTALREATGYSGGVAITVKKRIPLMSGLGGDSSDAAATLKGLNHVWDLNLSEAALRVLAGKLGSDVNFFMYGGTAVASGRGETVMELPALGEAWFVILVPRIPVAPGKTAAMYARLRPEHFSTGQYTVNMVSSIGLGAKVCLGRLVNVFDNIAFEVYPDLEEYFEHMSAAGAREVHMAGSGPALFTVIQDKAEAEAVYNNLQQAGQECYLAESLGKGGDT